VIPPGVDTEAFFPAERSELDRARSSCGLGSEDRVVVYLGRLLPDKNLDLLLDAFALLDDQRARLLIIGDGALRAHLIRQAEDLGIQDRVVFIGRVSEGLASVLSLGRVCALPTEIEGFGLSFLEALACGVPCVGFSSALPGAHTACDEIIEDARTGRIAREAGAQGLADAIAWVLSRSEAEWKEMSELARSHAEKRFSWRRFAGEVLALRGADNAENRAGQSS
jgi:glycosyltransferase involved in cell wall biosynthesis